MSTSFARFLKHLPRSQDLMLVVLKGHLLIEEEINEILTIMLNEPSALFDAHLSFRQRLAVLRSVVGSEGNQHFRYDALQKLNVLRNELAHNLEPKELDRRVKMFLEQIEDPESEEALSELTLCERLKRCIALLCGELAGWQRARRSFETLKISRRKQGA